MTTSAADPPRYDFLADCPARYAVDLIGDTWTIVVLHALRASPQRPRELRAAIGGISPKMLNDTLRKLLIHGLVVRRRLPEAPPRVDYELTGLGRSLLVPIDALAGWVLEHEQDLARADRDAASPSP